MPVIALSAEIVRTLKCPLDRTKIDYFDAAHVGLLVEVRLTGGKTYYQRYLDERGRTRQFKIGTTDVLSLAQARRKARQVRSQAVLGFDPQQRRRELRLIPTLMQVVQDRYLPYVKSYKRSWKTDETVLRLHILPALGFHYVDTLTAQPVAELVTRMRNQGYAPGTTNRVVIILRHIFNIASKWDVPGIAKNPTAGINLAPDVNRERFLNVEEFERLIMSIEQDENRVARDAIKLLLLTGARRNEVTYAKWEHVDWEKKTLLVPRSKSGKVRAITLNGSAIALLRSIIPVSRNEYIFPAPTTGRPCPSLYFPWNRIRLRAKLSDLRLHDLRHSFASYLVNNNVSLYKVQQLLGHSNSRYTQRYAHLSSESLLEAAEMMTKLVPKID